MHGVHGIARKGLLRLHGMRRVHQAPREVAFPLESMQVMHTARYAARHTARPTARWPPIAQRPAAAVAAMLLTPASAASATPRQGTDRLVA